ncbi:hypothetical protein DXG01_001408 [Tephrocybe rancida]|nr:hypothetical protein DXG01_001408 [Tephrocybe rancida]
MGSYPDNPVSGEPFVDKITIELLPTPEQKDKHRKRTLTISAPGAPTKPYIKLLIVNGRKV